MPRRPPAADDPCAGSPPTPRQGLPSFQHDRAKTDRDSTTMLSPWIHMGSISVRHVYYRVAQVGFSMGPPAARLPAPPACGDPCVSSTAAAPQPGCLLALTESRPPARLPARVRSRPQKHAEWQPAAPERGASCLDFVQQLGYREYSRWVLR